MFSIMDGLGREGDLDGGQGPEASEGGGWGGGGGHMCDSVCTCRKFLLGGDFHSGPTVSIAVLHVPAIKIITAVAMN